MCWKVVGNIILIVNITTRYEDYPVMQLTDLVDPISTEFLENPTNSPLAYSKKFTALQAMKKFFTVFARTRHRALSAASVRSILTLLPPIYA
jgi:hypothetical protein